MTVYLGPSAVYLTADTQAAPSAAPTVTISSPTVGASVYALSDVTVEWEATPASGRTIASVTIHSGDPGSGGRLLATSSSATGSVSGIFNWAEAGARTIYVRATDDIGETSDFATRAVTVATWSEESTASSSVGTFSDSNHFSVTTNGSDMTAGNTVVILFDRAVTISASNVPWCCNAAGTGWLFEMQASGALRLTYLGGASYTVTPWTVPGRNCAVFTRTAAGNLRASMNGGAVVSLHANPTSVTNSGSANRLGRYSGTGFGAAATKIVEVAHIASEVSDATAEAVSGCINTLSTRHRLPDSVRTHASLSYYAHADDYDATAGTWVGRDAAGSVVITWARTGTVVKNVEPALRYYPEQLHWWNDATFYEARTIDGLAVHRRNTGARVHFATDATRLDVMTATDLLALTHTKVGTRTGASYVRSLALGILSKKLLLGHFVAGEENDIWDGSQSLSGGADVLGTHIAGIAAPAVASFSVTTPVAPDKRFVVLADSIGVGDAATDAPKEGFSMVVRLGWGGGVTVDGWGYGSLYDLCATTLAVDSAKVEATAQRMATALDGNDWNCLLVQVMTNDFGYRTACTHTLYQAMLEALLDRIHILRPSAKVVIRLASTRSGEATPNAGGSTLAQFRTAAQTVATARAAWCSTVDPMTWVTYGGGDYAGDNLHLSTAGHAKEGAGWIAWIGANGG